MELTKKYRVAWKNDTKEVILLNSFPTTSITGTPYGFDADTKAEIDNKIETEGLIVPDDLKEEWRVKT